MNLIFWQIMPSHHQSGAIRHCAQLWPGQVHGVYDMRMHADRQSQGWQIPDMGSVQLHFLDETSDPQRFVADFIAAHPDAVHVLGGFRGCRSVDLAWRILRHQPNAKLASIAERPDFQSWRGLLQHIWYRQFFARYGRRFRAVLAMSSLAVDCFKRLWCPADILYPFMYQADNTALPVSPTSQSSDIVRFAYVGRFAHIKGVDLLCKALESVPPGAWQFDWIGSDGEYLELVRRSSQWHGGIRFLGPCPSNEVINRLTAYDACIIPSRYDGWGMVGTEACMAGIGCIVSDNAGCSDLVRASGAGDMVRAGDVVALRNAMMSVIADPARVADWKRRACDYRHCLRAELVGQYLYDVLMHAFQISDRPKPVAPWLKPGSC